MDAANMADCSMRVIEIKENLTENEKIRVISISKGYGSQDKGYRELAEAINRANEENMFVITTSTEQYYDFNLFGAGKDYMGDPDDTASYYPAKWVKDRLYQKPNSFENRTLVPMGSRAYAGHTNQNSYTVKNDNGLSWAVPWCAGFYALCCQVDPDMTPEKFIEILNLTGERTKITIDDREYSFGKLVNPRAVIDEINKRKAQ